MPSFFMPVARIIIYKIEDDMCNNSTEAKIAKFKIFKFLNNLNQDGKLKDYEYFCISLNNKHIVEEVQLNLCLDYNVAQSLIKNKELDKIK